MAQLILSNRLKGFQDALGEFGQTWGQQRQLKLNNKRMAEQDAIAAQAAQRAGESHTLEMQKGKLALSEAERARAAGLEQQSLADQLAQADTGQVMGPSAQGDFQAGLEDPWAPMKDRLRAKMFTAQGTPTTAGDVKKGREDQAFKGLTLRESERRANESHGSQLETDKVQRTLYGSQAQKNAADANRPHETARELPIDVKGEVGALSTKNAGKISVMNQIGSYLKEFRAAKTDDDKARIGGQMLKVLNSPEGADAIGVEEAKRLGDALEYNVADVKAGLGMKPGNFHGRDLAGFERQVQSTYDAIKGSVSANREEVGRILGRPAANGASGSWDAVPGGNDRKSLAEQALNDPDATPAEKAQARRILGLK